MTEDKKEDAAKPPSPLDDKGAGKMDEDLLYDLKPVCTIAGIIMTAGGVFLIISEGSLVGLFLFIVGFLLGIFGTSYGEYP